MSAFSLCSHMWGEKEASPLRSLSRGSNPLVRASPLGPHLNLITPKDLISKYHSVSVRVAVWGAREGHDSAVTEGNLQFDMCVRVSHRELIAEACGGVKLLSKSLRKEKSQELKRQIPIYKNLVKGGPPSRC